MHMDLGIVSLLSMFLAQITFAVLVSYEYFMSDTFPIIVVILQLILSIACVGTSFFIILKEENPSRSIQIIYRIWMCLFAGSIFWRQVTYTTWLLSVIAQHALCAIAAYGAKLNVNGWNLRVQILGFSAFFVMIMMCIGEPVGVTFDRRDMVINATDIAHREFPVLPIVNFFGFRGIPPYCGEISPPFPFEHDNYRILSTLKSHGGTEYQIRCFGIWYNLGSIAFHDKNPYFDITTLTIDGQYRNFIEGNAFIFASCLVPLFIATPIFRIIHNRKKTTKSTKLSEVRVEPVTSS